MSIQSEIERITANITNAYSILSAKGATMPDARNTANLAAAIESIQGVEAEAMSIETIREICGYVAGYLPKGYTLLEYIQSSGAQYINTGFKPNQDTRLVMDFEFTDSTSSTQFLFGLSAMESTARYSLLYYTSGYYRSDYGSATTAFPTSLSKTGRYIVDKNKKSCTIGSTTATSAAATFSCTKNLYLLAGSGASVLYYAPAKLYSCQIYDNGNLVRQFVPCINPDGEIGLYDLVGAKFYGNAGTGAFTAGPALTEVEYIQSDGNARIDSGITPTNNTKIEVKAFGDFYSSIGGTYRFGLYCVPASSRIDIAFGSTGYKSGIITGVTFPAVMTMENGKMTANGSTATFTTQSAFTCSSTLPLFTDGSTGGCNYYKIYESGVLVRDFVPYLRSDGIYGLYDKVNNKFYTNAGSGNFTGG